MMEGARPATVDDLIDIAAIAEGHLAGLEEQRGGSMFLRREMGPLAVGARVEAGLDDPDAHVIVGTYDDVVFGYGYMAIEKLNDGSLLARVDDFVVDPEAREVGIGEAMMDRLMGEARARGCVGIDSRALPGDRETKNFFESFGLKARMLVVHMAFDDTISTDSAEGLDTPVDGG